MFKRSNWSSFGRSRPTGPSPRSAPSGRGAGRGSRRFRLSPSTRRSLIAAAVIAALFILLASTASFWVNWWWFDSLGYRDTLTTRYVNRTLFFLAGFLAGGGFLLLNLIFALRRSRGVRQGSDLPQLAERLLVGLVVGGSVLFGLTTGAAISSRWETWQLALRGGDFAVDDPVFGRDVGFYVFRLPALDALHGFLVTFTIVTTLAVAAVYVLRIGVNPRRYRQLPDVIRPHLFSLVAVLLALVAARYWLNNYELVYSTRGAVYGTGFTDDNVQRWANIALVLVSLAAAALALVAVRRFQPRLMLVVGGVWLAILLLLGLGVPALVQRAVVEPSELRRETPYIENNIAMTRTAYGIDAIDERDLTGQAAVTAQDLRSQPATIENIRLWDYRFAIETFQQLQALERFYEFNDVDVDRYLIDGRTVQVLVSARELDVSGLPENAQTWTNRHLAYTHGYGVVVSPVSEVDSAGRPVFIVGGLGDLEGAPIPIARPEIYFGESGGEWVILGTNVTEYTEGGQAATGYEGTASGSISLDGYLPRLISSMYLGDRNVLLSGEITGDSRLVIRRGVVERAAAVAPFLRYDADPYLVVAGGRLVWVIDAYTATERWPHATPVAGLNYLRNSVKVTVDAYDGTVTFYRTAVADPIADAYADIFPDLMRPISEVPPEVAAHFRYPETLFELQSEVMRTHHVTDPRMFFEGNDEWAIPRGGATGDTQMEPYFVTMALPGEAEVDFTLIRPFIPGGRQTRQNMSAWMAGRTDAAGNGRLVVYEFPRDTTVFGPQQIEARIDQDTDIAPEITLLSQAGSEVIRGNMLVIPINESVLYVQPLYVRASNSPGAYPELGKVIVASSDAVVMRDTLDQALAALVGNQPAVEDPAGDTTTLPPPPAGVTDEERALAAEALAAYDRAQAALEAGDWATYGEELAEMEALLERLAGQPAPDASPAATPVPAGGG